MVSGIVAIDIETRDTRGASFEYHRPDFCVFSLSCAWRDESGEIVHWFSTDSTKIAQKLLSLSRAQTPLTAHNLSFEYGVLTKLYPRIQLNWHSDTMRLGQLWDAGGAEFDLDPILSPEQMMALELNEITEADLGKVWNKSRGLSLEACALRFLDSAEHNHKKEAHDWLTENHGIKRGHGQHLHLLPPDVLERYNNSDTRVTLLLYEDLTARLGTFDWSRDWTLYFMRIQLMSGAYTRGIRIDRPALFQYIIQLEAEIKAIEDAFRDRFKLELELVQELRLGELVNKWAADPALKSDRARANRFTAIEQGFCDDDWMHFNVNSPLHLALLFSKVLKITPTFLTKTGQPSFKSSHMGQWGLGGEILIRRKKRIIVLNQAISTYLASALDRRAHCSIRVSGTKTNRSSSGGLA